MAGIGKEARRKLASVLQKHPGVLTSEVVSHSLDVTRKEASRLLSRWNFSGWVQRIKRGAYVPLTLEASNLDITDEDPYMIISSIYNEGYVGAFSAIKHWDLSEQITETVYYFTSTHVKKRDEHIGSFQYKIKTVTKDKFFGLKPLWFGSKKVYISDPTKTIVDLLDDPKLVGRMTVVFDIYSEYIDSEYCDYEKMLNYIERMNNKTIYKRLGFMLETKFGKLPDQLIEIENKISSGYTFFDTLLPSKSIVEKWMLRVPNSWKVEYDRKKRSFNNCC